MFVKNVGKHNERILQESITKVLSVKLDARLGKLADEIIDLEDKNSLKIIRDALYVFMEDAGALWRGLESGRQYNNLAQFKNRTGVLRDNTGFRVYLDGRVVVKQGTVGVQSKIHEDFHKKTTGRKYTYQHKGVRRHRVHNLNLVVFADERHGKYVNNPLGRRLTTEWYVKKVNETEGRNAKIGDLWQGTGWFNVYYQLISHYWRQCLQKIHKRSIVSMKSDAGFKKKIKEDFQIKSSQKDELLIPAPVNLLIVGKDGLLKEARKPAFIGVYQGTKSNNTSSNIYMDFNEGLSVKGGKDSDAATIFKQESANWIDSITSRLLAGEITNDEASELIKNHGIK